MAPIRRQEARHRNLSLPEPPIDRSKRLTYEELRDRVGRLAAQLEQELGIRRGDRLVLLTPNRLEVPVLLLALWSLGAVAVHVARRA